MFETITMFIARCDKCGNVTLRDNGGWMLFTDMTTASRYLQDAGWMLSWYNDTFIDMICQKCKEDSHGDL